jgi:hypothetical protein
VSFHDTHFICYSVGFLTNDIAIALARCLRRFISEGSFCEFRWVGPVYGVFGLGMGLYFASQGAGRLLWPWLANMGRLVVAAGGGWLALHFGGDVSDIFLALAVALGLFGIVNAAAIAGGAWFTHRTKRKEDPKDRRGVVGLQRP